MNKKNITIIVSVLVVAIILVLLILFGSKKEIKFDSQGGSSVTTQSVRFMNKVKKPTNPTRDGYTFDNWYYNDGVYDFDTKVTKGMTLIARWIKNGEGNSETGYTVLFDTNGGSALASIKVEENGTITKPQDPTREGYKFAGWQLDGKDFDFSTKVTKNVTLTAKWEKDDSQQVSNDDEPKLSSGNFSLKVGGSKKLSVRNAKGTVTWSSSNTSVATVDKNGNVKAIKAGTTNITAKVDGKTLTIRVTVSANNSGNQGGNQGGNTGNEEKPPVVDPQPEDPKPLSDYRAVCEKVADSSVDQCTIRIKDKNGNNVEGRVTITSTIGTTQTVATGSLKPTSLIASLAVASVN